MLSITKAQFYLTKAFVRSSLIPKVFFSGNAFSHSCPYAILGVPRDSDYTIVKQAFLKAAMHHHPDRNSISGSPADSQAAFIRYRQAFEQIVQKNSTKGISQSTSDPEIAPYFREDHLAFEMDDATRKEVIRAYETLSHGGKDKGGYWEMARQLAERESSRPAQVQRLEPGTVTLRRRRKK
ncbi:hypothetical protein FisN_8Hh404 [Fistulifera solaris]|jgi:curved DNA-binding protein CbpA|uniref:J domain-containing protein n=1 Tax=Fistulifera solaris TaxID=1519565 RepID=A0A1Z5JMU9_FISSO|nr:hypothetical protein FisN_8Hh404 [Fistulifera solaris]|eukprot:GAX15299.1 hypothetical protein FisN_8Hh404 [Fistulifera solaris]